MHLLKAINGLRCAFGAAGFDEPQAVSAAADAIATSPVSTAFRNAFDRIG
jgi:hypothetical protein